MTGFREAVENLRSARRYGGVPNDELRGLIEGWRERGERMMDHEPQTDFGKGIGKGLIDAADELEDLLSKSDSKEES